MAVSPDGSPAIPPRWSTARPRPPSFTSPNAWRWSSAKSGIRVNSISPGAIATGIFGKALGLSVEAAEKTPELMHGVYKSAQPIPRAGLPEDIAHAAVFLASDESSFINGHDLVIDGAITGGKNWTQQQQGYVALRKAFGQARRSNAGVGVPISPSLRRMLKRTRKTQCLHHSFVSQTAEESPFLSPFRRLACALSSGVPSTHGRDLGGDRAAVCEWHSVTATTRGEDPFAAGGRPGRDLQGRPVVLRTAGRRPSGIGECEQHRARRT